VSTKKRIYLIRHGQTDFNKNGIVQGSGVDSDLNDHGRWQAKQFYRAYHHIPFGSIYTSEMKRTVQSVANFLTDSSNHIIHPGLNEISWGKYEGVKSSPEDHKQYVHIIEQWKNGNLNISVEGGETPLEMQERQKPALQRIVEDHSKNILISMHGRAMRSFLCLMLDQPLNHMDKFRHSNLCLYVLNYDGVFQLEQANDISHLVV
jgi:broad specificity phosphatase PhoE